MNNKFNIIMFFGGLLAIILLLNACNYETSPLPNSSGGSSEVLVLLDNAKWQGKTGELLRHTFEQPQPGLPQDEAMFRLVQIAPESFTNLFKTHRNILNIEFDATIKEPKIEVKKDIQATPQKFITIYTPNDSMLQQILAVQGQTIMDRFLDNEYRRTIKAYLKLENKLMRSKLTEFFDFYLIFPEGYYVAKAEKNFAWIRSETPKMSQALIISTIPYRDTAVFNGNRICRYRDSICQKHIPGPVEGSYMSIATTIPPVFRKVDFKGNFAIETRGMWEVKNEFMGGPFVSYTFVDKNTNLLVTLDGYVYAPKNDKLDLMRQVEAIMHSITPKDSLPKF